MAEFESSPSATPAFADHLKSNKQVAFLTRHGNGELQQDTSSAPFLTESVMQRVYDHFNLHDSPFPKNGNDEPLFRAIQTAQFYLRNTSFTDGLSLNDCFEDAFSEYFDNNQQRMNRAAIGAGFMLFSYNQFLQEPMGKHTKRWSKLSGEDVWTAVSDATIIGGEPGRFRTEKDIFDPYSGSAMLPPYQIHLIDGLVKLTPNCPEAYEGAVIAYKAIDTLWPDLLEAHVDETEDLSM